VAEEEEQEEQVRRMATRLLGRLQRAEPGGSLEDEDRESEEEFQVAAEETRADTFWGC